MKLHLISTLLLCVLLVSAYTDDGDSSANPSQDSGNPYASDKNVKHSLFLDKNLWNRVSGDQSGVPLKKTYRISHFLITSIFALKNERSD